MGECKIPRRFRELAQNYKTVRDFADIVLEPRVTMDGDWYNGHIWLALRHFWSDGNSEVDLILADLSAGFFPLARLLYPKGSTHRLRYVFDTSGLTDFVSLM